MAEEITKYVVSVGFDAAIKNLNKFQTKMANMESSREAALKRQIALQKQLNSLMLKGSTAASKPTTGAPISRRRLSGGIRGGFFDLKPGAMSNRAAGTLFAEQMKGEESVAKKAARQKELLDKQIKVANRYRMILKEQGDELSKNTSEQIRQRIATAKTAEEVKDIVAQERARLATSKRNTKQAQRQNFLLQRMQASSKQMAGNLASAFAVGAGVSYITKTGQDFESVNNTMLAVSTNAEEAGNNFQFVREESFRLGLGLKQAASGFAKMVSARGDLTLEQTKQAFTGISEMSTLLGLSAEESGRAINALQQMMSKGVVSAEELKLQMGEVLPNAIPLMAKAAKDAGLTINGTVKEMMALQKQGGLISSKVLPFFAKRMSEAAKSNDGLNKALLSNRVAMNRFSFSMSEAADNFFKSKYSEGLTEFFNESARSIRSLTPLWKALGKIIGSALRILTNAIRKVTPTLKLLGDALDSLTDLLGDTYAALAVLTSPIILANLGLLSNALGLVVLPVVAMAEAFESAAFWAEELINAFVTKDKIGVLYDPRKGKNQSIAKNIITEGTDPAASDPALRLLTSKPVLQWIQKLRGGNIASSATAEKPIQLNASVNLQGEEVGRILMTTDEVKSGIDSMISPMLVGGF